MNTDEIMALALKMANMSEVPPDSGIYVQGTKVTRVLFGLDVTVGDLLLARQLGYDCVIAHHYTGTPARVTAWKQYLRHIDQMISHGIPEDQVKAAVVPRAKALEIEFHMDNYDQVSSAARHLKMPFLNIHSPLDEIGRRIMQEAIDSLLAEKPEATVEQVASKLAGLPVIRSALTSVEIRVGDPKNRAGKVVVSHGALRNGGAPVAQAYFRNGISTVVYIHISPADYSVLNQKPEGNLIVTGHISSDSLGIVPFVQELRKRGLEVLLTGGIFE